MDSIRVRIAPSPTGIPHIGTTRTALFNYLFAKKNNGRFILRIEDTDRKRLIEGAEEKLQEIFEWLGFQFDEKYKQSERLEIYKEHANKLAGNNFAYEDNGAIRFNMPKDGTTSWTDAVGNKNISFENKTQEDFVILKLDGYPTYNFANVIDDHVMQISHVIRGQEFISSTPKHIQLYKSFEWEPPVFAHLPLVLGNDHQKLSKRHGAKSALDYKDEGYLPEAINNFMALLGWSPGGDREIMNMDEMIQLFELKDINTSSSVFDVNKLEWMNGEYIRKSQISNLKSQIIIQNPKVTKIPQKQLDKIIPIAQSRMKTLNEFNELVMPFFEDISVELNEKEKEIAQTLALKLSTLEKWNSEKILEVLRSVLKFGTIRMPILYKILTGKENGLPIADMLAIIGKEHAVKKLQNT